MVENFLTTKYNPCNMICDYCRWIFFCSDVPLWFWEVAVVRDTRWGLRSSRSGAIGGGGPATGVGTAVGCILASVELVVQPCFVTGEEKKCLKNSSYPTTHGKRHDI
jgi:hypothetical protein